MPPTLRARALRLLAAATLASTLGTPALAASDAGRIAVARAATVERETVRLADIAVLEGNAVGFADLDLGPAPAPGASRRLDGVGILRRLREAGLDGSATRYEIPAQVRVARAYQEVGAGELRDAVERDAVRLLAARESLRRVEVAAPLRVPPGEYELRVAAPPARTRGARRRIDIDVVQNGTVVASSAAEVEVAAVGPVVTLRHAVARGAILGADDLATEERDLAGLATGVLTDGDAALGKEARTALAAGTVLTTQALASPLLVKRGDVVTVIVETPAMRLSVPGEALEAGTAGTAVRVRNRASQQEIEGRVVERGTVLVQY